jgi:hypothetical protein
MYLIRSLGSSVSSFFRDECHHLAASMTYFLILSIVPLGLLLVSLFGHILGENQELYRYLLSKVTTFFPDVTSGITDEMKKLITYKGISIITFFIYGFFALQLFYSAEHAMDVIFRVPKKRHFLFSGTEEAALSLFTFMDIIHCDACDNFLGRIIYRQLNRKHASALSCYHFRHRAKAMGCGIARIYCSIYSYHVYSHNSVQDCPPCEGRPEKRFLRCPALYGPRGRRKASFYLDGKARFIHWNNLRLSYYIYHFSFVDVLCVMYIPPRRRVC